MLDNTRPIINYHVRTHKCAKLIHVVWFGSGDNSHDAMWSQIGVTKLLKFRQALT